MNETEFHHFADVTLTALLDVLEASDQSGALEVEYQNGALSVILPSGKQLLISKHAPSKQLWLSSPVQGGLHFDYKNGEWQLANGLTLKQALMQDLAALANLKVAL